MSTNMTSKGQVTIPKRVREHLGIGPGSAVDFELTDGGEVLVRPARPGRRVRRRQRFAALRGRATVQMRTEEILALTRGG